MSFYRRFNKWKNNEWINEESLSHEEHDYFKAFNEIPTPLQDKLMYCEEKLAKNERILAIVLVLMCIGLSAFIGGVIGYNYSEFIHAIKELAVLP